MQPITKKYKPDLKSFMQSHTFYAFLAGLLAPLGFAPFHLPGLAIISIVFLFSLLQKSTRPFLLGFAYGLGFFGLGVSWVFVSIHNYGHLNILLSALITLLFIAYLSLFFALGTYVYKRLSLRLNPLSQCLIFSSIWCLCEYLRASLLGGFPWLLLGLSQIDTPIKNLLPILGVYGVGFITSLAATLIAVAITQNKLKHLLWILPPLTIIIAPSFLPLTTTNNNQPISIAAIQANLSMRDKWDNSLFLRLMKLYRQEIDKQIGSSRVIILPESAIPAPRHYVDDYLDELNRKAIAANTAILLGIPTLSADNSYYNSLISLGQADGDYQKIQLVPFGEFIPKPFKKIARYLELPITDLKAGNTKQRLINAINTPIASLICYELAYPEILRIQLPQAQWLVSVSDDGWFGYSLAIFQQQQMAQVLSIMSARYQVVVNNDGLSSIIDNHGNIVKSLGAFTSGILTGEIYPTKALTPWIIYGDMPIIVFAVILLITLIAFSYLKIRKRQSILATPII